MNKDVQRMIEEIQGREKKGLPDKVEPLHVPLIAARTTEAAGEPLFNVMGNAAGEQNQDLYLASMANESACSPRLDGACQKMFEEIYELWGLEILEMWPDRDDLIRQLKKTGIRTQKARDWVRKFYFENDIHNLYWKKANLAPPSDKTQKMFDEIYELWRAGKLKISKDREIFVRAIKKDGILTDGARRWIRKFYLEKVYRLYRGHE